MPDAKTDNETQEKNQPVTVADELDLLHAHRPEDLSKAGSEPWYRIIGPGFVTGAADDDPSGVATYSQNGAAFGYGLLWLIPITLPMMIAVQEMCGRVALTTGRGLAAVIKEHYPRWLLYSCVSLLVIANLANIFADLNAMAASAQLLVGGSSLIWLTGFALAMMLALVLVPYRAYANILKWICLALLAYVVVVFLPGVKNDWPLIAKRMIVPDFHLSSDYILGGVAFIGTTISPYLFFWQAAETVEEDISTQRAPYPGLRKEAVKDGEIRMLRADTVFGMSVSQMIAFFIIVGTAGTLHVTGHTDINTAQDAAAALKPLGAAAVWLFAAGMIGTGLLAIPTLAGSAAYALSETVNWRYGLFRRFSRARKFYITIVAMIGIGYLMNFFSSLSPVKALVYSAVLNAVVSVPMMVVLMMLCNNKNIIGERRNGFWSNLLGGAAILFTGAASAIFLWYFAHGKV